MSRNGVVEEPISSELVLVDQALGRSARAALPEPPWLLPVLAELKEAPRPEPPPVPPAPPAAPPAASPAPAARRRPRLVPPMAVAVPLAALAFGSLAFLPLSRGPTLGPAPSRQAATAAPARPPAAARPKRAEHPASTPTVTSETPKPKSARTTTSATPKRPHPRTTRPATPRPRTLPLAQRVVSWRRDASAVFYELHLQRGVETLYETRTATPKVVLPARLALRPGTYRLVVRPAVPSDAGIILGAPILRRTMKV